MWGLENWNQMIWGGAISVPLFGTPGIVALAACFFLGGYVLQNRHRSRWLGAFAAVALLAIPLAAIATVTLPHVFVNGQVADADQVNTNFAEVGEAASHRTIARVTSTDPADQTDSGVIASRSLNLVKEHDATALRIVYSDSHQVRFTGGGAAGCRWEVRVDGASCPSGHLVYDRLVNPGTTDVVAHSTGLGYCSGLPAGPHTLQVVVSNTLVSGTLSDCTTGGTRGRWVLEAEEVY